MGAPLLLVSPVWWLEALRQVSEVDPAQIESMIQSLAGYAFGLFLLACLALLSRQAVENIVAGWIFKRGAELAYDQTCLLSGRPARLIRVGTFRTIFIMTDRFTKLIVPNSQLHELVLEVKLSKHINGESANEED